MIHSASRRAGPEIHLRYVCIGRAAASLPRRLYYLGRRGRAYSAVVAYGYEGWKALALPRNLFPLYL